MHGLNTHQDICFKNLESLPSVIFKFPLWRVIRNACHLMVAPAVVFSIKFFIQFNVNSSLHTCFLSKFSLGTLALFPRPRSSFLFRIYFYVFLKVGSLLPYFYLTNKIVTLQLIWGLRFLSCSIFSAFPYWSLFICLFIDWLIYLFIK